MSEKRKDSKGRVLKDGESQRANGTYDYQIGRASCRERV